MEIKSKVLTIFSIIVAIALLVGMIFLSVAFAGPLPQGADPRPSDGGSSGDGAGGGGGSGNDGNSSDSPAAPNLKCASLVGQAFQWGVGGIGGVTTELKTGSWQISAISATDGNYGFGGLGIGVATLHVALTPEQAQRLQPLIQDAGVYLNCDFPTIANIALFTGDSIEPPVTIEMSASRTAIEPGQKIDIFLTVNNGLPTGISNVVVTDLFPPGLTPLKVFTGVGPDAAKILNANQDGYLVAVNLDKMATGAKATIRITVMANTELSDGAFSNTATLFYRESAAHQASLDFTVGQGVRQPTSTPVSTKAANATTAPTIAPTATAGALDTPTPDLDTPTPAPTSEPLATPTSEPVTEATPTSEPAASATPSPTVALIIPPPTVIVTATAIDETEGSEDFVPPNGLPTTGDEFVPPPLLLPVTGQDALQIPNQLPNTGFSSVLPVSGLGLAGLAFVLHRLRISRRNKE